ncbi:response regulator [Candidatus Azambacteria bacterium]|nr:response regulator [Candidatus Azambacteria bacterium]
MSIPQKDEGAGKTILLAHSNIEFCNSLGEALKSLGFGIVIAQDGETATTLFHLYQDQIKLVLTDIVLPKKDGFAILGEIRAITKNIPVVILTNLDDEEDIKKAKEMGAEDYIIRSKITTQDIAKKVSSIIHKSSEINKKKEYS